MDRQACGKTRLTTGRKIMNIFEKLIHKLSGEMTTPTNYSWFHLMCVAIVIAVTVAVCILFARKKDEKVLKTVTLVVWSVMFLFEVYKQIVFSFNYDEGQVTWDYRWYAFPYQLCSTPLYVLPVIFFLKDGKLRDNLMLYISTFALVGGLIVMIYPNDVFVKLIGINIQTMTHHGLQIVIGIFYIVYNREKISYKNFFKYGGGIGVFVVLLLIAVGLNVIMPKFVEETFNMFYVGPKYPCSLLILGDIYTKVPYPVFLCVYTFGFMLLALIVYSIYFAVSKVAKLVKGNV